MPSKSKAKGNRNEILVAEMLTKWWGGEEFKRMPTSGALRWNNHVFTYGDLLPASDFPGIVECKHYAWVDIDELLRKAPEQGMITWWYYNQLLPDVKRCKESTGKDMVPMLVWKMNNRPWRICLPHVPNTMLVEYIPHIDVQVSRLHANELPSFSMYDFEEFLSAMPPANFLLWAKQLCEQSVLGT